jgi:hypothetical protein
MTNLDRMKLQIGIWVNLAIALVQLKLLGFNIVSKKLDKLSKVNINNQDNQEHLMTKMIRISRLTYKTAASFPGRADCLPRSICLFRILRKLGYNVDLIIGVKRPAFKAHAWVEYKNRPISESMQSVNNLTPIWSTKIENSKGRAK